MPCTVKFFLPLTMRGGHGSRASAFRAARGQRHATIVKEKNPMHRHILKIGNARYTFNQAALCAFIAEAKMRERASLPLAPGAIGNAPPAGSALQPVLEEADRITALYRSYRSTGNIELLMELKSRLEKVSVLYESHALAEEVLSINACLPYERRVPWV
ncbi:hypothetical protein LPW11_13695 [Geomonas sp. RF6]|uniref:hypothetical protein n=1 Tax=Geomonas sp. RF6 TaxID=2897342 RepID=UPI001E4B76B0|nr:hypothetical protein [Geomonas sp. RF6]UFS68948.1 hypothetical protein LPW11_13695 [Geomonas sp. RF6]